MDTLVKSKTNARLLATITLCVVAVVFAAVAGLAPSKAYAATASLSIPVSQIFSLGPESESQGIFSYELRRVNSDSPLPAGAVGDVYSFTLTGSQTQSIGPLVFNSVNSAHIYEIRSVQEPAEGYTLDDRVYTIIIGVSRTPDGGLVAEIRVIYLGVATDEPAAANKVEEIVFEKDFTADPEEYEPGPEDPPPGVLPDPPTGTPGGGGAGAGTGAGQQPPSQGPKTGDYADPMAMLLAMAISAIIVLFSIGLIYMDRRGEKDSLTLIEPASPALKGSS